MSFKVWLESSIDIYSFPNKELSFSKKTSDLPIPTFGMQSFMNFLLRKRIGEITPESRMTDEIYWGKNTTGSIKIKVSPNNNISIHRLVSDLEGNNVWICKQIYKVKEEEFHKKEDVVADELFEKVSQIAQEPIDNVNRNFTLDNLIFYITKEMKSILSSVFFYEDTRKVDENYYIIFFSLAGSGQGKIIHSHHSGYAPQMQVDISYEPSSGIITISLNTISISREGGTWNLDFPFFNEKFAPSQKKEEIVKAILASIKFF